MKTLDRLFGCLIILGGVGHGVGSFQAYKSDPMSLLWALSASYAGFLLGALNLLRAARDTDRAVAWICFAGCLVWTGFVLRFGMLLGNFGDFRVVVNLIITLGLAAFSLRGALRQRAR